jgi:transcriptional regulator with XRE-family HTH domain
MFNFYEVYMNITKTNTILSKTRLTELDKQIGESLRIKRKLSGATLQNMQQHLGVSIQQIQKYEQGANRISVSMLVKIATFFQTNIIDLMKEILPNSSTEKVSYNILNDKEIVLIKYFRMINNAKIQTSILDIIKAFIDDKNKTL